MPSRRNSIRTLNLRALDAPWNSVANVDWITWAKEAGVYISPLLMGGLLWLETERRRLLAENKSKDDRIFDLSERVITIATELKTYLFNERKA